MSRLTVLFVLTLLVSPLCAASPQQLLQETTAKVMTLLDDEQERVLSDPDYVYKLVDELVLPHFDFEAMSRYALARLWRRATPDQRRLFVNEFRQMLVRTYARSLNAYYEGARIRFLPSSQWPSQRYVEVRTEIVRPGQAPIPVDYRLLRSGDDWKVFDIAVSGISLVTTYRGEFASAVRSKGLDGLIADLRSRNAPAETTP